jgi:hypothetical protein
MDYQRNGRRCVYACRFSPDEGVVNQGRISAILAVLHHHTANP